MWFEKGKYAYDTIKGKIKNDLRNPGCVGVVLVHVAFQASRV